jgi:hypothetical protein
MSNDNNNLHINATYNNIYETNAGYNANSDFNNMEKIDLLSATELGKEHLNENDKLNTTAAKQNDTIDNQNKSKVEINAAKKPRNQTRKRKSADAKIDDSKDKYAKKADDAVVKQEMNQLNESKNLKEEPVSPRLAANENVKPQIFTQESVPLQDQSNNNNNVVNYDNVLADKPNSELNALVDENKNDCKTKSTNSENNTNNDNNSENLENTNKTNTDLTNTNNEQPQKTTQSSPICTTLNKNLTKPQIIQAATPTAQTPHKYIITKITTNRINPSLVQNKLNFNFNVSESLNIPSSTSVVSSNTPLVKLMTSHSRDPILASSSVSSPVPSPSTSTSSSSSNSSSSNQQSCTSSSNIDCQPCMQIPCLVNNNHGY